MFSTAKRLTNRQTKHGSLSFPIKQLSVLPKMKPTACLHMFYNINIRPLRLIKVNFKNCAQNNDINLKLF